MYKKDYLVRQFEELGKVLGVILFLKKQNDWESFQKEISLAVKKFSSLEIDSVEQLDLPAFNKEVLENEKLQLDQKKALASLLFEKLDFYTLANQPGKQKDCAAKCLALYTFLNDNQTENEFNLEVFYRLEFLKKAGL